MERYGVSRREHRNVAQSGATKTANLDRILSAVFDLLLGFPDPRQGPESPFPEKEGFGVQKPPFPFALMQAGERSFLSENPQFPVAPWRKKGTF